MQNFYARIILSISDVQKHRSPYVTGAESGEVRVDISKSSIINVFKYSEKYTAPGDGDHHDDAVEDVPGLRPVRRRAADTAEGDVLHDQLQRKDDGED